MKKSIKILSVILVTVLIAAVLMSCGLTGGNTGGGGNPGGGGGSGTKKTELKPSSITKLANIPNYSNTAKYPQNTVSYGDTTEQEEKLGARILEKQDEIADKEAAGEGDDVSAVTKIFANSDAAEIISRMSVSGLPKDKMISTVDYLAGEETVTSDDIDELVASGTFNKNNTARWSFFDDYDYYKKLQDRVDDLKAGDADEKDINDAEDNVKRQYRNMAGKVFAIGMIGDEFARTVTNELEYATEVTETMAGAQISIETSGEDSEYDIYAKEELDYETLVYLRAFNQFRGTSTGFIDCVELYGYYYDYNKTTYYSQTDEVFEKQLKYGHQETFTNDEWWEYMEIERNSYVNAYRYTNDFYNTYYSKHFRFQAISEAHETFVYGIQEQFRGKSYTAEMRTAVSNKNFDGQLAMTDWLWCYNGDRARMNAYNEANTLYNKNKKLNNEEKEKEGEFQYDMQQLKMVQYLMQNMTDTELTQMMHFQVYSYSSEMIESAQGYMKDQVLVTVGKKLPEKAIRIIADLSESEAKVYAVGKIDAMLDQMDQQYSSANVDSNGRTEAKSYGWAKMRTEIATAIDYDYMTSDLPTWVSRVERLEDLVVKRQWSCGAEIGSNTCTNTPNNPHAECDKEYDMNHQISKFVSNHEVIIRYMSKQHEISFQGHKASNANQQNDYNITATTTKGNSIERTAGYKGTLLPNEVIEILYEEVRTITIDSGKTFDEALKLSKNSSEKTWWESANSRPAKANGTMSGKIDGVQHDYTLEYTFSGWYLDEGYKYLFDPKDDVKCSLTLYAGYDCVKTRQ